MGSASMPDFPPLALPAGYPAAAGYGAIDPANSVPSPFMDSYRPRPLIGSLAHVKACLDSSKSLLPRHSRSSDRLSDDVSPRSFQSEPTARLPINLPPDGISETMWENEVNNEQNSPYQSDFAAPTQQLLAEQQFMQYQVPIGVSEHYPAGPHTDPNAPGGRVEGGWVGAAQHAPPQPWDPAAATAEREAGAGAGGWEFAGGSPSFTPPPHEPATASEDGEVESQLYLIEQSERLRHRGRRRKVDADASRGAAALDSSRGAARHL
eukprot:1510427-Rhodomonas_salina.1